MSSESTGDSSDSARTAATTDGTETAQTAATTDGTETAQTAATTDGTETNPDSASSDWIGLLSILLLSITAIVTAWAGFESSKWGGEMSISFTQAGTARLESATTAAQADRTRALQVGTFSTWLVAQTQDDKKIMKAVESRLHEPLKTAFSAWIATKPFKNPDAPDSPFDMPEYTSPEIEAAAEAGELADALFAEGLENNQRGDNYTILAVLGAVVLFFTAMSTRVKEGLFQWILLGTGLVIFTGISILLISYPKII